MADPQQSPSETPLSERFIDNANLAFGVNTFTEVLLAMSAKLLELGVPGAETVKETDRANGPLLEAMFQAENIETHNAARKRIFMRVLHLGRLLPPEEADGAFLVDRVRVRHLLRRWHDAAPSALAEKYQEHAELGDWYYDYEPNKMRHLLAVGQWRAETRFGDPFAGNISGVVGSLYGEGPPPKAANSGEDKASEDHHHEGEASLSERYAPWWMLTHSQERMRELAAQPFTDGFYRNVMNDANQRWRYGSLMALSVKLRQLGVPGAESIAEAEKTNHQSVDEALNPKKIKKRSREEQGRAMDALAVRVFHLGSRLPPEAADGAFLADRAQVEALVAAGEELKAVEARREAE